MCAYFIKKKLAGEVAQKLPGRAGLYQTKDAGGYSSAADSSSTIRMAGIRPVPASTVSAANQGPRAPVGMKNMADILKDLQRQLALNTEQSKVLKQRINLLFERDQIRTAAHDDAMELTRDAFEEIKQLSVQQGMLSSQMEAMSQSVTELTLRVLELERGKGGGSTLIRRKPRARRQVPDGDASDEEDDEEDGKTIPKESNNAIMVSDI